MIRLCSARDARPVMVSIRGGACVVEELATTCLAAREWRGNGRKAYLRGTMNV